MSWGYGRRREKLLVIVLDINIERCCCWLLSETKQGELEMDAQVVRE